MPKLTKTPYITPYGKAILAVATTPELHKKISERAYEKSLSKSAYIISLINEDLEKAKKEERDEELR